MFSRQDEGYLSLNELVASFEKLDVSATQGQKKVLFAYFQSIEKTKERDEEFKKIGLVPTYLIVETFTNVLPESDV